MDTAYPVTGHRVIGYRVIGFALLVPALVLMPARAQAQDATAPADPSRLIIGPTGRLLAPGEGYLSFDALFVATVQVGVTRHFSMGGGALIIPIAMPRPMWVTPKVQLYGSERLNVAAGVIHMFVPGEMRSGFAYTVATIGGHERSMTIGGGALYVDDVDDRRGPGSVPVVVIGGERRVSPRVSFLTENYLGRHGGLVTGGFRWRRNVWQVKAGGVLPIAYGYAPRPGIWFSFAYKLGGK
jgi:hypothetical protein